MVWLLLVSVVAPDSVHGQASLAQSAAFKDIKILNSLCWELTNRHDAEGLVDPIEITVPIDRWVFIRSQAKFGEGHHERHITIDADPLPVLVPTRGGAVEAMRYLEAGSHTLHVKSRGDARLINVVVRAIPELQHALYGESCHVYPYGPYDWNFLKKDVLPNVNLIISNRHMAPKPEEIGAWKTAGRAWIDDASAAWHLLDRSDGQNMRFKGDPQDAADAIYD